MRRLCVFVLLVLFMGQGVLTPLAAGDWFVELFSNITEELEDVSDDAERKGWCRQFSKLREELAKLHTVACVDVLSASASIEDQKAYLGKLRAAAEALRKRNVYVAEFIVRFMPSKVSSDEDPLLEGPRRIEEWIQCWEGAIAENTATIATDLKDCCEQLEFFMKRVNPELLKMKHGICKDSTIDIIDMDGRVDAPSHEELSAQEGSDKAHDNEF